MLQRLSEILRKAINIWINSNNIFFKIPVPPIQKCQLSDPECIKKSAQSFVETFTAGIPEVGTEVLEPVHIDVIKIDLSGLKLTVRDADIKGLKKSVIDKLK